MENYDFVVLKIARDGEAPYEMYLRHASKKDIVQSDIDLIEKAWGQVDFSSPDSDECQIIFALDTLKQGHDFEFVKKGEIGMTVIHLS